MSKMKTTYEVTLKITLTHDKNTPFVESNSVKGATNLALACIRSADLYTVFGGDTECSPDDATVKVVKLKENGRRQAMSLFGTEAVPWNDD